jgi:broad specificity polyphosphatase/5'/3'-nucleotidase SurE
VSFMMRMSLSGAPLCRRLRRGAEKKAQEATDLAALESGCIAVTPLKIDMTDKPRIGQLARLFEQHPQ